MDWAWRVLGALALVVGVGLLVFNPALTDDDVTVATLAAAYLVPAGLAVFARTRLTTPGLRNGLGGYALIAGFVWIALQVRQVFHPDQMSLISGSVDDPELWAWSGGWLLYGIALMAHGVWRVDRAERLAALGVIALVCAKVFLIDMADLTGLLRVLSFLALGLSLIGLTVVHRRFVLPREQKAKTAAPAEPGG